MPLAPGDFARFVEAYLLDDRATLIARDYEINVGGQPQYLDFVVVKTDKRVFYLVEISLSPDPAKLKQKLIEYRKHSSSIARGLCAEFSLGERWTARPLFFVRHENLDRFATEFGEDSEEVLIGLEQTMLRPQAGHRRVHEAFQTDAVETWLESLVSQNATRAGGKR
jgi:hypothetical protein